MPPRPCIHCRRLTPRGVRCPCTQTIYQGDWPAISRAQRQAEPRCRDCGATTDLTADHLIPGTLAGGLATRCRSCNSKRVHA